MFIYIANFVLESSHWNIFINILLECISQSIGNHPHIGLIITDGSSNILSDMVEEMATSVKNDSTYIIGVGQYTYNYIMNIVINLYL